MKLVRQVFQDKKHHVRNHCDSYHCASEIMCLRGLVLGLILQKLNYLDVLKQTLNSEFLCDANSVLEMHGITCT